jgi:hypothetical protein
MAKFFKKDKVRVDNTELRRQLNEIKEDCNKRGEYLQNDIIKQQELAIELRDKGRDAGLRIVLNLFWIRGKKYNENGEIVNHYKLLAGVPELPWFKESFSQDSKLFISKDRVKYMLYGPYKGYDMEANCLEVIYEIKDNGSLEKVSEKNYKAKKIDQWNW